jgi:hypothetical protein
MRRAPRSLGEVVPVAAVEPDGLVVTSAGTYVRLLELARAIQPLGGGLARRAWIGERLGGLAAALPAGQRLQVLVEAEPLDPDRVLADDWREISAAADVVPAARAEAMRRLGYGLEQTVRASAPTIDAAELRWTLAVGWTPTGGDGRPPRARRPRPRRACLTIPLAAHELAAEDSWRLTDAVRGDLVAAGAEAHPLDGTGALRALARAINPAERPAAALAAAPRVLDTTDAADALAHRGELVCAIAGSTRLRIGRDQLERAHRDDPAAADVEVVMHLSVPPAYTSPWWLLALSELPAPWRLAVHVTATDQIRERRRFRRRHRRVWADLRRRERDGRLIGEETYEHEREAAEIDAELRLAGAGGLYDVSLYLAIRRPASERDELTRLAAHLAREFESFTDARLHSGQFLVEDSWASTLPLALDRLGATRRFAQRNIADCLPLLSTSASSHSGVPLGYALPGQTLERVDFFDARYRTHVALVTGASGSGKTVAVNALLARNLARGARGYIIDRSSSQDERASTRHAGHYEQLAQLIPGARVLHFGARQRDAILNPWDVPDPGSPPAGKVEFLLALHTLLIGDPSPNGPALAGLERTQLTRAIQTVYERSARTGEPPRERLLFEELRRLARDQTADQRDGDASVASELRRLAERLHPYIEDGPIAWLADRPTTIEPGAPLALFDLAGLPDALTGPVILTLVDFIDRDVAQRRARHIAGHSDETGPWAGKAFLAIDEAWKQLLTAEAGGWLNEWARRTRHIACALLVITQHLEDFANPPGRALLRNSVLRLLFHTAHDELDGVRDALGLHDEDLQAISALETRKGEHSSCLLDSEAHGRTIVRIHLGDIEYWATSADPDRDQPLRALATADADGDPWGALRLLVDPDWHHQRARHLSATSQGPA